MKSPVIIWRHQKTNYQNLGAVGRVISKTRIIEAPAGFCGPYWVVMVQLPGIKVVGQWVDSEEPKIGMKVTGILRRIGEAGPAEVVEYGVKWKKA